MFRKFFARDRMVMAGLIILGAATVAAGFVSGRSTFQYALSTDARHAAAGWVERVEGRLFQQQFAPIGRISGQDVTIAAPKLFGEFQARARETSAQQVRIARSLHAQSGLLGGIDKLFSGWITRLTSLLEADEHVSKIRNFALLEPNGALILRSDGFNPEALASFLANTGFRTEFYKSLGMRSTRFIDKFAMPGQIADEFHKGLIVPLISGQKIARVYILAIDQSSAAAMSKIVFVAVSTMTSLLIVLGFSVPAAVAFRRIRQRWNAEDKIRFLAMHDPLTGLPNRVQWQNRLEQALARVRRRNSILAVMCIDLDRFKEVNDTFGHKAGDVLLMEASKRLRSCVRETDIVARLGGDEFAVLAEDLDEPAGAIPLAQRICQQLAKTFDIEGHEVAISGSVGITLAPTEGSDTEDLLCNADLALYRAKNDGRNTFCFFEPEMDSHVRKRRLMASELRHALHNDGLHIHYQPQFDLRTGVLTGYEALARWTHEEMGEIPPSRFISIAEENGLIGMLGEWVLQTACLYTSRWPGGSKLTVNISPAQFVTQDLAVLVGKTLSETGLAPERLLLEFTEDVLLRNNNELRKTFKQLTAMGVLLAIDNFGTGNSSISNLTRLPVSKIKIDQSFIHKMESDKDIGMIVNMIVGLGKSLGVTISAGGIETESQAQYLRQIGCNEGQGFLFGRPQTNFHHKIPTAPPASDSSDFLVSLTSRGEASVRPGASAENTPVELQTEPVELPCEDEAQPVCELTGLLPGKPAVSSPARVPAEPDGELQEQESNTSLVR